MSFAAVLLACAACGSGGDDPLVLYPNETQKVYAGVARTSAFQNVGNNGALASAGGPETKEALTFAYGHAWDRRTFATITAPVLRNVRGKDARASFGDPSIAVRYTAVMTQIAEPWIPQVQLSLGYKDGRSRSIHESEDLKTLLDVFGSGFSEAKAGADIWYSQSMVMVGLAHTVIAPVGRDFGGEHYQPGVGGRTTVSFGALWGDKLLKTTAGANRDARGPLVIADIEQPKSAQINNSLFMTADWFQDPASTIRLSMARQAAFGANQNTARAASVALAYMRAI